MIYMAKNTKVQTFANSKGEIIATGRITPTFIDLTLKDGTRFYRSESIDYKFLSALDIAKVVEIGVENK